MLNKIFSKARAEILSLLFDGNNKELYLSEIVELGNISLGSVQNELKNLLDIDLITYRKQGSLKLFKANTDHPLYGDFLSIVEKTVGPLFLIKERLTDDKINCAFIFGSFAREEERAHSDIDLMIIGSGGLRHSAKLLSGIQEKVGREINPHVYSKNDFIHAIKNKDHFVTSVLKNKIILLKGDIHDFKEPS